MLAFSLLVVLGPLIWRGVVGFAPALPPLALAVCAPIVVPSFQLALASPLASVVVLPGVSVPPPAVALKLTLAPATARPSGAVTR